MKQDSETQSLLATIREVEPIWTGVKTLRSVLNNNQHLVLHAGPPFRSLSHIPQAVRHSMLVAILYEGWAEDKAAAEALLDSGGVDIAPAQDYDVLVPLAGVVTPSMYVLEISDAKRPENKKYSVLNEGMVWCTRLGIFAYEVVAHLKWLHQDFGNRLSQQFAGSVALAPILQISLLNGDDGHARTVYASRVLADTITSWGVDDKISRDFLYGAMAFALNIWMAASALILAAQSLHTKCDCIVKVGGNGDQFGLQLSSLPNQWLVVDAPQIQGNKDKIHEQAQALGTIGDSAVVDFVGLGGQSLDIAGLSAHNLQSFLPTDYLSRSAAFLMGTLPFLGNRLGVVDYQQVLATGQGPLVLLGMIDDAGERGRIGGGVAVVDALLLQALEEWQDEAAII